MLSIFLFFTSVIWLPAHAASMEKENILIIFSWQKSSRWNIEIEKGFSSGYEKLSFKPNLFYEYMDAGRFKRQDQIHIFKEYLHKKYAGYSIDTVVFESPPAARLLISYPDIFESSQKYVLNPGPLETNLPSGKSTVIPVNTDYVGSVNAMLQASKGKTVYLVTSATKDGQKRIELVSGLIAESEPDRKVVSLIDLSMGDLLDRVSKLDNENSVVFFLLYFKDASGVSYVPYEAVQQISQRSGAEVYTAWSVFMGAGVVGGYLLNGEMVGEMLASMLENKDLVTSMNSEQFKDKLHRFSFDWHQLNRWNIAENKLPIGSDILYKKPIFYQVHFKEIIVGSLLIAFFISFLWVFRLRKEIVERKNAQNDQLESERKLTTLIGNLPGIAYRCLNDKNWTMTYISDGCKDLTGYNPSDLIDNRGLAYGDLIVLEDRQIVWRAVQAAISENRSFTIEYRIEDKNKNEKWVWERGSCTSELKGKNPVLEGFISDITERKRAERSLRDSSKLNELMLNSLPHPTMLISKKRIILAANKVALDTGVEIGRLCWDTFGHRDCISEEHKQRIESSSNCYKDDILCTFCLADNLIKTGEIQNDPEVLAFGKLWDTWWVPIDEDTYLHYAIDITERKYAANRLLKEIERSNLLLELYLQAPKLSDKELYDYTLNKAVNLTDSTIGFFHQVSEDQKSIILNTWNIEALKTCGADQGLHYLIENAGNWVDCFRTQKSLVYNDFSNSPNQKGLPEGHVSIERFMSIPVMEEDKVRYIFGVGNKSDDYDDFDVTQLQLVANELYNIIKQRSAEKELEKLQAQLVQGQKMESIGTLAGGIAHDFNNILSSILGFTELAMDDVEKDSMVEDNLQEVHNAGKRAKDLVAQILAFARQSDEKIKPTQVNKIVEEVLQFMRSSIPTNIEIKKNIDSDSPILGNQTQIHQIIMNICTNAAYAMDEYGGVLEVRLKDTEVDQVLGEKLGLNQDHYITISITDNGVGIPPDILDSIFDPYFTTKGPGEGTGMGLAMAHGIVESYGGKIYVNSTLGKGSTFTIYLPIARKRSIQRKDEPEELPKGMERILFVDDEASLAKMGTRTLEALGYQVRTLTSSVDALDLFKIDPNEFDLVISDITMPNITGDKLAIELKKLRPEIPIILCTGYSKRVSEEQAIEIGVNALAYKPIVKAELAKTVRKVLDGASLLYKDY